MSELILFRKKNFISILTLLIEMLFFSKAYFLYFYLFSTIIGTHNINKSEWQVGQTKVFLRFCAYEPLEESRQKLLSVCSILIQKTWKGYIIRKGEASL